VDAKCCVIGFALRLVDVVIYVWIGWFFLLLRRKLTRRDVFARRGKRTLVIADVPWVHQSLEMFVSKLFALSYGDNGLDVHGANPVDSLVHRFTHRVQRGVLIALGRPDGRVSALTRNEGACLLAAMQSAAIQNMGTGPEIFSVGHNTWHGNPSAIREHVVLPTYRRPFMCEFMASAATSKTDLQTLLSGLGAGHVVSALAIALISPPTCDHCGAAPARKECMMCHTHLCAACNVIVHEHGSAAMREHTPLPLSAALRMRLSAQRARQRLLERTGVTEENDEAEVVKEAPPGIAWGSLGAGAGDSFPHFGSLAASMRLTGHGKLLQNSGAPLGFHHGKRHLAGVAAARARARWRSAVRVIIWSANPWKALLLRIKQSSVRTDAGEEPSAFRALYDASASADISSRAVLDAEAPLTNLFEGRFASLERYVGFLVMFHAMALRVSCSSWPLPPWDISRSQSILRVASTAAPVSGAEVAAQLAGEPQPTAFAPRVACLEGT
jgi:hypothetical protein